jgi:hypothetical protein
MKQKLYALSAIDRLISKYMEQGGDMETIREGSLGYGTVVLSGEGLKTCIIRERYLNESSSGHSVRFHNKKPAKFAV